MPVISGDMQSLEPLFREHHQMVISAAYRITGSLADSEDVAQSVFLRLLRGEVGLDGVRNMKAYLQRAAVNAALDLLRSRRESQFLSISEQTEFEFCNPSLSPDRMQHASEIRNFLRAALARLQPRMAEMFVLRYVEEYDLREVARMMKTSRAVVAVTLHRVRTRLKKDLRRMTREGL